MEQKQNRPPVPHAPRTRTASARRAQGNDPAATRHASGHDPAPAPLPPGTAPAVLPPEPGSAPDFDPVPLRYRVDWHASLDRLESGAMAGGFRVWRDARGRWWTSFPPPPGFHDYEGDPADPHFARPLSEAEEKAIAARTAGRIGEGAAARDRFFGFTPRRGVTYRRSRSQGRY